MKKIVCGSCESPTPFFCLLRESVEIDADTFERLVRELHRSVSLSGDRIRCGHCEMDAPTRVRNTARDTLLRYIPGRFAPWVCYPCAYNFGLGKPLLALSLEDAHKLLTPIETDAYGNLNCSELLDFL